MLPAAATSRTNKNGLLGWWPFNGAGATDYSGNQNHGTLLNAPTVVEGPPGGGLALKFNGSNQGVQIANTTALSTFPTNSSPGSISAWVNLTTTQDGIIVGKLAVGREVFQLRNSRAASNRIEFRFVIGSAFPYFANSTTLCSNIIGTWTHVVGVADGTNLNIYINGRLEAQAAYTNGTAESGTWGVGKDIANNGTYLNGAVGDPRVYNRALGAAEVYALYAEGLVPFKTFMDELPFTAPLGAVYLDPTQLGTNIVLSNLNLTATQMASATANTRAIAHHVSGKYYCEFTVDVSGDMQIGICNAVMPLTEYLGQDNTHSIGADDGGGWLGAGGTTTSPTLVAGHVYGLAIDITSKKAWIKDITAGGNWNSDAGANPVTGVGGATFSTVT